MINLFKNKHKATKEHEGQTWAVLWNPYGVKDFGEKPVWREGVIKDVCDLGFVLDFGNGVMICNNLKGMKQVN